MRLGELEINWNLKDNLGAYKLGKRHYFLSF